MAFETLMKQNLQDADKELELQRIVSQILSLQCSKPEIIWCRDLSSSKYDEKLYQQISQLQEF